MRRTLGVTDLTSLTPKTNHTRFDTCFVFAVLRLHQRTISPPSTTQPDVSSINALDFIRSGGSYKEGFVFATQFVA